MIREEIRAGKTDKEMYAKPADDFGETVLYAPRFNLQTAGLWLSPVNSFTIVYSSQRSAVNDSIIIHQRAQSIGWLVKTLPKQLHSSEISCNRIGEAVFTC